MSLLVAEVEALPEIDFLQRFEDGHSLKEFKIGQMSPSHALELYQDVFTKYTLGLVQVHEKLCTEE